jgi:tRNA-dihydrouridine synthase
LSFFCFKDSIEQSGYALHLYPRSHSPCFEAIAAVKAALAIPVIANGGTRLAGDANTTMSTTGADAVMVGQTLLQNPRLFSREHDHDSGVSVIEGSGCAGSLDGGHCGGSDSDLDTANTSSTARLEPGHTGELVTGNDHGTHTHRVTLAYEYLSYARSYPPVHPKSGTYVTEG